jgi:hypothetical protein
MSPYRLLAALSLLLPRPLLRRRNLERLQVRSRAQGLIHHGAESLAQFRVARVTGDVLPFDQERGRRR